MTNHAPPTAEATGVGLGEDDGAQLVQVAEGTAEAEATGTAEAEAGAWLRPSSAAVGHPPVLDGADVSYTVQDTAVGRLLLATRRDGALLASAFTATDAAADALVDRIARRVSSRVLRLGTSGPAATAALDEVRRQLDDFLSGQRRGFDLRVELVLATAFQQRVLRQLSSSAPYGVQISYGQLASAMGAPTASRAVGAALGANPLCVVLPCHRVVAASGALTGYAGGLAAKQLLLELEAGQATA